MGSTDVGGTALPPPTAATAAAAATTWGVGGGGDGDGDGCVPPPPATGAAASFTAVPLLPLLYMMDCVKAPRAALVRGTPDDDGGGADWFCGKPMSERSPPPPPAGEGDADDKTIFAEFSAPSISAASRERASIFGRR